MPIKRQKGSSKKTDKCRLAAVGDLTISTVSENHKELLGFYAEYSRLEIDLSAVEEIDCSGIQLLLALNQTAQKEGNQLLLCSASAVAKEAMDVLDIKDEFNWEVNE